MTLSVHDLSLPGRLSRISATLRPGEVTAICGPNGAGKSTLLAAMAGLLAPATGSVALGDRRLAELRPRERAQAIGYLPQSPELAWDVSVDTLVSLGRIPWPGAPAAEARAAMEDAIAAMDLGDLRQRPVSCLSGGERARALVARVLAGRPRWLLADEPLANLDLAHGAALVRALRQQAAAGCGVVLVLHDLASAMNHADRVLVLEKGQLVEDGPPALALREDVLARVWGVKARWLGDAGGMALAIGG